MNKPPIARSLVVLLIAGALFLPIAICVVAGVGVLLNGLGDPAGAHFLARTALAVGILWMIDLISLIVVLAINSSGWNNSPSDE